MGALRRLLANKLGAARAVASGARRALFQSRFQGSERYWNERYAAGGTSGPGSFGRLAEFKARTVNAFVRENGVRSVVEHGCGDGNQLRLAVYPRYLGLDVSAVAIELCSKLYATDDTKEFRVASECRGERADLALSLDVIFHLVEDEVFDTYMARLFGSAERFVIIYSSDTDEQGLAMAPHVRHRRFSRWIAENAPEWKLRVRIPNPFPYRSDMNEGSFADFYVYERRDR